MKDYLRSLTIADLMAMINFNALDSFRKEDATMVHLVSQAAYFELLQRFSDCMHADKK